MPDAANYAAEWKNKGYSGNYVPVGLRDVKQSAYEAGREAALRELTDMLEAELLRQGFLNAAGVSKRVIERVRRNPA